MTHDEARAATGQPVTHHPPGGRPERGVIVRVTDHFVFVLYGDGRAARATHAEHLTLVPVGEAE